MRHTLGLFHGQTGSNFWKRYLSENLCVRDADVKKIDHIMDKVKLAPPIQFGLEEALEYIQKDEYVEVTLLVRNIIKVIFQMNIILK